MHRNRNGNVLAHHDWEGIIHVLTVFFNDSRCVIYLERHYGIREANDIFYFVHRGRKKLTIIINTKPELFNGGEWIS